MKAISASLIILTGDVILCVGAGGIKGDTGNMISVVGGCIIVLGALGWYREMSRRD